MFGLFLVANMTRRFSFVQFGLIWRRERTSSVVDEIQSVTGFVSIGPWVVCSGEFDQREESAITQGNNSIREVGVLVVLKW